MKQLPDGALKIGKSRVQRWRTDHEHKIVAWCDVGVELPHGLSDAPLGSISVVRFAKLLAYNKAAACMTYPITCSIHNEQRVRPRLTLATHPLKLLWSLQPLAPPHAARPLAMSALYTASLIAYREFPAAFQSACLEHQLSLFCRHARQEAMFTAARNPLRLPRSLGHESTNPLKNKNWARYPGGHTKSVELAPRPRSTWS